MIRNFAIRSRVSGVIVATFSIFFALVTSTATASTAPLFLPAVTYASRGDLPYSVAVADLNGDGKPDLLVANCATLGPGGCVTDSGNGAVGETLCQKSGLGV